MRDHPQQISIVVGSHRVRRVHQCIVLFESQISKTKVDANKRHNTQVIWLYKVYHGKWSFNLNWKAHFYHLWTLIALVLDRFLFWFWALGFFTNSKLIRSYCVESHFHFNAICCLLDHFTNRILIFSQWKLILGLGKAVLALFLWVNLRNISF